MDESREISGRRWRGSRRSALAGDGATPGWTDIRYETADGVAKITIARPEVRNAFRPLTTAELITAFDLARDDPSVGVVVLTGDGPSRSRRAATRGSGATTDTSTSAGSAA